MAKTKTQIAKEEMKEYVKKSFDNFELIEDVNVFKYTFSAIKNGSRELKKWDIYDFLYEALSENVDLKNTIFFKEIENKLIDILRKLKNEGFFHSEFSFVDSISNYQLSLFKKKYYEVNADVEEFDNVFKSYLQLYQLSKSNKDLIEFRDIKSRQIDELHNRNPLLIHKSIVVWERIEKIKLEKYTSGEMEKQYLTPLKKYKEEQ